MRIQAAIHHLGFFFGSISHNWFITFLKLKSIDFLVSFPKKKAPQWRGTIHPNRNSSTNSSNWLSRRIEQGRKSVLSCAPPPLPFAQGGRNEASKAREKNGDRRQEREAVGWTRLGGGNAGATRIRAQSLSALALPETALASPSCDGRVALFGGPFAWVEGDILALGQERKGPLKEEGDEELGCVFCRGADLGVEGERPRMQVTGRALEWRPERERRTARRDGTPQ